MGNGGGSYRTTLTAVIRAYDKLPPLARRALADAVFDWAPQQFLSLHRSGASPKEIAEDIARCDRLLLEKYSAEVAANEAKENETTFNIGNYDEEKRHDEIIAKGVAYACNLADTDFKPFSSKRQEEIGSKNPIHVGTKSDVGKIGRIVCTKSQADYLISENGLKYLVEAELAGRIAVGVVVLMANWRDTANGAHAVVILDKLREVPTQNGPFGPFWAVDRDFAPARGNVASEEEAF
jgi:hypothetical protein